MINVQCDRSCYLYHKRINCFFYFLNKLTLKTLTFNSNKMVHDKCCFILLSHLHQSCINKRIQLQSTDIIFFCALNPI